MTNRELRPSADQRSLAQFFFEVGFGACFAEVMIRNDMKQPFPLSDAMVERQWEISTEAYDDPFEMDRRLALANAVPELLAALEGWAEWHRKACVDHDDDLTYLNGAGWDDADKLAEQARAAIAKALGHD